MPSRLRQIGLIACVVAGLAMFAAALHETDVGAGRSRAKSPLAVVPVATAPDGSEGLRLMIYPDPMPERIAPDLGPGRDWQLRHRSNGVPLTTREKFLLFGQR